MKKMKFGLLIEVRNMYIDPKNIARKKHESRSP